MDAKVSNLTGLTDLNKLESLTLYKTAVSDLSPLANGLQNLEELDLRYTVVSDLTPLTGLKNIGYLYLGGTSVSEKQIDELKMALPNCDIVR